MDFFGMKDILSTVTMLFQSVSVIRYVWTWIWWFAVTFLVEEREYGHIRNRSHVKTVVEKATTRSMFTFGKTLFFDQQKIPQYAVGKWFFCYTETRCSTSMNGPDEDLKVHIWTWKGTPPLVTDVTLTVDTSLKTGHISVLKRRAGPLSEFCITRTTQRTLRAGCPTVEASMKVVKQMAEQYRATGEGRFVLYGPPGSGKSTALRLLAEELGAEIFPSFNPTIPSESIEGVIEWLPNEKQLLLAGLNEVDCVLDKFGTIKTDGEYQVQVHDKKSWNQTLDDVADMPNVILVMTTNRTMEDMLSRYDSSLLRPGRVTGWFAVDGIPGVCPSEQSTEDSDYSIDEPRKVAHRKPRKWYSRR